ncbi:MAG: aromatic ring-hydroxylating dioxygenase subunit alpha [bacterium]
MEARFALPPGTGQTSAARVLDDWYVVCRSRDLGAKPQALTVLGLPLAFFRDGEGRPAALLDRCPHRNVPLSGGKVADGCLECPYHGWRFDGGGACRRIPGLAGEAENPARAARSFSCVDSDGYVWVWPGDGPPSREPFRFPHLGEPGWAVAHDAFETVGTLHAVAENALDVPHTAFLHRGLFRGTGKTNELEVVVRRFGDRVEAEYIGEPAPRGLVGRLLAPGGGMVTHFDRFILPGVAQVEYRLSDRAHIVVTSALTPVDDQRTRLFAVVAFRLPLPAWLVRPVLQPIARGIFKQDARILALQSATIERFGGEEFVSTELDALGAHIRSLLKQAERGGERKAGDAKERRFRMRA